MALRLVHPLRVNLERLAAGGDALADQPLAIGGMIGLGSFLYAFGRMADWLKAPELIDAAHDVTTLITPQRIMKDERLDVVAGCAGTLLALLSFMQEKSLQGNDAQLSRDLALLCGQRLLDSRITYKSGSRAWPACGRGIPIPGFAYGAAGISCSLARLSSTLGRSSFLKQRSKDLPLSEVYSRPNRVDGLILKRTASWISTPGAAASQALLSAVWAALLLLICPCFARIWKSH